MENLQINIAIDAALKGGKAIMDIYSQDFEIFEKADKSPLTTADTAAHGVIKDLLHTTGLPLLSEEGKAIPFEERENWAQFWMVDPLDGTKEFIKRNGEFTVNIALIDQGAPVMGVVYAPAKNLIYFGEGDKAFMAETTSVSTLESVLKSAMALPSPKSERAYTVVASRSHMSDETVAFVDKLKTEHGMIEFLNIGSSLKLCMVAEGRADIYPRLGPTMEWDTAAAHAVCLAAGRTVAEYPSGKKLIYNKPDLLNPFFIVR